MRQLTTKDFQEFLKANGYDWSGYFAENYGRSYEHFNCCGKYENCVNNRYILLGSPQDWDWGEADLKMSVFGNPKVRYIRQSDVTFKVYNAKFILEPTLEKDLSNEWVKYQALNIEGYIEETLSSEKDVQKTFPDLIKHRKTMLAKQIKRLIKETNEEIESMLDCLGRSIEVEQILKPMQQERLIKKQIQLGAKDNFKDNASNDACLQHLTDTFEIGK